MRTLIHARAWSPSLSQQKLGSWSSARTQQQEAKWSSTTKMCLGKACTPPHCYCVEHKETLLQALWDAEPLLGMFVNLCMAHARLTYVAVAGRKGTLFLSLFDHFFRLRTVITWTIGNVWGCKLTSNNFNLSIKRLPALGL